MIRARWIPDLPRFALLDGPSPLQRIPRFAAAIGGGAEVWIKREDLLPLAFGGNKLRNLEFLVGAALAEGADTLVTTGRRWSNHARLTAAAGAKAGLDVHLVLSGPPVDPPGPNQRLDELLGAAVHSHGRRLARGTRDDRGAARRRAARCGSPPVHRAHRRFRARRRRRVDPRRPRARRPGGRPGYPTGPRDPADRDGRDAGRPPRRSRARRPPGRGSSASRSRTRPRSSSRRSRRCWPSARSSSASTAGSSDPS